MSVWVARDWREFGGSVSRFLCPASVGSGILFPKPGVERWDQAGANEVLSMV